MKITAQVSEVTGGIFLPILLSFLGEALKLMIPWFVTMFTVVICDLAAGLYKSYRLKVPIRFSRACRDTMGKLIVYFTFVVMVCCINIAAHGEFHVSKWAVYFIVVIEIGSIVSNLLKPHGINLSLNAIIKAFLTHSTVPITYQEAGEIVEKKSIDDIRKEELEKLNDK